MKPNQSGFTLVSAIMATAILAIVVLGMGSVLTDMFGVLKTAGVSADSNDLYEEMRLNFASPPMCDAAFTGGASVRKFKLGAQTDLNGLNLTIHGAPKTFAVGSELQPGMILKSIKLMTNTGVGEEQAINVTNAGTTLTPYYRYQGSVIMQITRKVNGKSTDEAPAYIPISFASAVKASDDPTNEHAVASCGSTALSQATCESLNYVWDSSTSTCKQANECSYGGSYSKSGSYPGNFVNLYTGSYSCPNDSTGHAYYSVRSGSISYATKCGKYCVKSNIYPVYQCIICKDDKGNPVAPAAANMDNVISDENTIDTAEETPISSAPAGSYTASCNSCTVNSTTHIMQCSCKRTDNHTIVSKLDLSKCNSGADVSNIDGSLSCTSTCGSTTGTAGPTPYTCNCGGALTYYTTYFYSLPIHVASETCLDGSHWSQSQFGSYPSGAATHTRAP